MLRLDRGTHKFIAVPGVKMRGIGLLERADLQRAIRNSPDEFFKEELGEDLALIGEEVRPADFVDDRIDLLAVDTQGRSVIVELKRGTNKLHLLQAITYAAMVANWPASRIAEEYSKFRGEAIESFLDEDATPNLTQRIILVAEDFEYEVLVAAQWLTEKYKVDIRCYRLSLSVENENGSSPLVTCTCIYPPPEITAHAQEPPGGGGLPPKWSNWEEAVEDIENLALREFFQKELAAGRENYLHGTKRGLRFRINGKRRFSVWAHSQDAYVWQYGRFKNDEEFWEQALGPEADVVPVKRGRCLRFYLETKDQIAAFSGRLKKLEGMEFVSETEIPEEEEQEK